MDGRQKPPLSLACFSILMLFLGVWGYQGKRLATHLATVEDASALAQSLYARLVSSPSETKWLASQQGGPPPLVSIAQFDQQSKSMVKAIQVRLSQISEVPQNLPFPASLDLKLTRATLAMLDRRFSDASELLSNEILSDAEERELGKYELLASPGRESRFVTWLQISGDASFAKQAWREALECYERLHAVRPRDARVIARIADCQHSLGNLQQSLSSHDLLATRLQHIGDAAFRAGDHSQALESYARAIDLRKLTLQDEHPSDWDIRLAKAFHQHGLTHLIQGELTAALADYEQAIHGVHELADDEQSLAWGQIGVSYNDRGVVKRALGQMTDAVADFKLAIEYLERTWKQQEMSRNRSPDESLSFLVTFSVRGVDIRPSHESNLRIEFQDHLANSLLNHGYASLIQNDFTTARQDFQRSEAIYRELMRHLGSQNFAEQLSQCMSPQAWILVHDPDVAGRDGKRAIGLAHEACELSEWKDTFAMEAMAAAQAEIGNVTEAIQYQSRALKLAPREHQEEIRARLQEYESR